MIINNSYYQLGQSFFKEQKPEKVTNPTLIAFNAKLAKNLDLNLKEDEKYLANIFSGNKLIANSKPISLAYSGHQFGHFAPQLGDGRAILLGEITDKKNQIFDIQLKGSGKTFFSRNGDGKCPLDAAIKEYIISEAMHFLKIPTTRSLAIIKSDDLIQRENLKPASVITRIAKSHIRIGTFQYFAYQNDLKNLKILANYTINRHYPQCYKQKNPYLALLKSVLKSQAKLVSSWMSIGFIHGVMNTDNTAISGQTIDYGPCAFMDEYNKNQSFSYIDKMGRYGFSNQKNIILWNLIKFAETILPLINSDIKKSIEIAQKELNQFPDIFDKIYFKKMAQKIGIFDFKESDKDLIIKFLDILEENKIDFTNGFRSLSKVLLHKADFDIKNDKYQQWQNSWITRLKESNSNLQETAKKMQKINPILIPRNHIVDNIIKQALLENNFSQLTEFLKIIEKPFSEKEEHQQYYLPPKEHEKIINTFCGT